MSATWRVAEFGHRADPIEEITVVAVPVARADRCDRACGGCDLCVRAWDLQQLAGTNLLNLDFGYWNTPNAADGDGDSMESSASSHDGPGDGGPEGGA